MSPSLPSRHNTEMAKLVDAGIALDAKMGAANAWVFMASAAVPIPVLKRVLAHPSQRRLSTRA